MEQLIPLNDLVEMLVTTPKTIYNWRKLGLKTRYISPGRPAFSRTEVKAFLELMFPEYQELIKKLEHK